MLCSLECFPTEYWQTESYFKVASSRNDRYFQSWTLTNVLTSFMYVYDYKMFLFVGLDKESAHRLSIPNNIWPTAISDIELIFLDVTPTFFGRSDRAKALKLKVCMLVCDFTSHSRSFHSYSDITITSEGLQIATGNRTPISRMGFERSTTEPPRYEF